MIFSSQVFILGFLPVVLALWYGFSGVRWLREAVLILASLVFYAWWDIRFVPLLVGLTLANWLVAAWFRRYPRRWVPLLGVALNLLVLAVFKYANFLGGNVAAVLGGGFQPWDIVLPLGLSFFTFQKISYLLDLRRGDRHFYPLLDFCLFVFFFPQLIAGPLVRHNEIIEQFRASPRRPEMWENLSRGLVMFILGVAEKTFLADMIAPVTDRLFAQAAHGAAHGLAHGSPGLAVSWLAALCFGLQIYFDFSGYSDMAIGLGRMFGFRLPQNFNAPYRAVSIRDFWRRWHMTLSRFLRDYLYIPMGGNRGGGWRQARNVVLTMLLGGLWHGAAWTFVAWGGLHGVGLAVNGAWARTGRRMPGLLGWALTTVFVLAGWVLFRAPDFATAGRLLAGMAGLHGVQPVKLPEYLLVGIATAVALGLPSTRDIVATRLRPSAWMALPAGLALVLALLQLGTKAPGAFIYFQF